MEGNRLKFPKNIAIDWVALVFAAAGDSSSCSIGFAKGVCGVSVPREERNSRCCDAEGVGRGSGCAASSG